jgi:hypothetical protein
MTNSNYTDITAIIDRSGSMMSLKDETIGGFNSFLEKQQEVSRSTHSKAVLQIVQFDDQYEPGAPSDVLAHPKLNNSSYQPRGMTALHDAIGKTINITGARFAVMPESERPEKVLFLIITDGFENSSKEFTLTKIREMITHQNKTYNWDFIYLGSNQDAWSVGQSMGFTADKTLSVTSNAAGHGSMYASASAYTLRTRSAVSGQSAVMDTHFTEEDKTAQDEAAKNS